MSYFNFPHSRTYDSDLGWLIKALMEYLDKVNELVELNSLKIADPINWNITTQYPRYTIVINSDGMGYISRIPVPEGIALTNTTYWLPIFDFSTFYDKVDDLTAALNAAVATLQADIAAEAAAREAADQAETAARENADQTIQENIEAEALARETAVNALNAALDHIATRVNVKSFGAVGNAAYLDIVTNQFYTDSTKATRPTSDADAVNAAIQYALDNGYSEVYFPKGSYYLPNWTYTLNTDVLRFVGDGNAELCSEGLAAGSTVIRLTSATDLIDYQRNRNPISGLSIIGAYHQGDAALKTVETGITAVMYGESMQTADNFISPHILLDNVAIRNFDIGIAIGTAYKSTMLNCTVIACDYGILITGGTLAPAVPLTLLSPTFEVCKIGLYCSAEIYNHIVLYGGAFEYCRRWIVTSAAVSCYGVRFESDLLAAYTPPTLTAVVPLYVASSGVLCLYSCDILTIPNWNENVQYWIGTTSKMNAFNASLFTVAGSQSLGLVIENCTIATDQITDTSRYVIANTAQNVSVRNCRRAGTFAALALNRLINDTLLLSNDSNFL